LSPETEELYRRAQDELRECGAVLVADPFAGSGFADLRVVTPPLTDFDERGLESLPYDTQNYLERMGPEARLKSFADFTAALSREDPFGPGGVLGYVPHLPGFAACLADPSRPPDMSNFIGARQAHLAIFDRVFATATLDVLVFPQMRTPLAGLHSGEAIHETTVSEINIAGLPGVTVPAGAYASGAPFSLIAVGPLWSEADLLAFAFAYEQATRYRRAPVLTGG
jgi:aspartyl-tRNA(Asn)/glutamyl-tRNA(Gln) amidotransferase subunit A